jgi:hypothetical protein
MGQSRRMRAGAGTLALVACLATLTACGDGGSTADSSAQGKVLTGTDDSDAPASASDTVTAGQDVPDGFPDDVPLLDATVVAGTQGAPGGDFAWSVVVQTPRAIDDVTAEVTKSFRGAGYTAGQANEMGDVTILEFTSPEHVVSVTAARTGANVTMTYLVKPPA